MKIQRNIISFSFAAESRRNTLLKDAFMKIVGSFKSRPVPRSVWDETATGDRIPWKGIVTPIRCAVYEAVKSGDTQKIQETLDAADAFLEEIKADYHGLVPAAGEESLSSLALAETQAEGAANEAEISLVASPTITSAERAIGPLSRQLARLETLVARCQQIARSTQPIGHTRAWS